MIKQTMQKASANFAVVLMICVIASSALAQQPTGAPAPYDGIQAGLDAFRLAEEQRQAGVAQQLAEVDAARFWNGYPTSRGATIYYGYPGFGGTTAYGLTPSVILPPWGVWSGSVFGYPARYMPARQPIGQRQVQTGPNRWESHPVYDPPLTPYLPLPIVESPLLERTPYAIPARERAPGTSTSPPAPPAKAVDRDALPPGPVPREAERTPRGPREY